MPDTCRGPPGGEGRRQQHLPQTTAVQRQAVRRGNLRVPRHRLQWQRAPAPPRPRLPPRGATQTGSESLRPGPELQASADLQAPGVRRPPACPPRAPGGWEGAEEASGRCWWWCRWLWRGL